MNRARLRMCVCGCVEYLCAIGYNCLTKWVRSPLVCAPKMCHTSLNAHTWPEGSRGLGSGCKGSFGWGAEQNGTTIIMASTLKLQPHPLLRTHFASKRISTPILVGEWWGNYVYPRRDWDRGEARVRWGIHLIPCRLLRCVHPSTR